MRARALRLLHRRAKAGLAPPRGPPARLGLDARPGVLGTPAGGRGARRARGGRRAGGAPRGRSRRGACSTSARRPPLLRSGLLDALGPRRRRRPREGRPPGGRARRLRPGGGEGAWRGAGARRAGEGPPRGGAAGRRPLHLLPGAVRQRGRWLAVGVAGLAARRAARRRGREGPGRLPQPARAASARPRLLARAAPLTCLLPPGGWAKAAGPPGKRELWVLRGPRSPPAPR